MRTSTIIFFFAAGLLLFSPGCGEREDVAVKKTDTAKAGKIVLAENGTATAAIVIEQNAPAPVRFAAEELRDFLGKITGAKFKIENAIPEGSTAIVLGKPAAKLMGLDVAKIKRDGYAVKFVGKAICIAGKDDETEKGQILFAMRDQQLKENNRPAYVRYYGSGTWNFERGTLYGVYDFLESSGVRWFFPGPKGTVIPVLPTLSVAITDKVEEPAYSLRMLTPEFFQVYHKPDEEELKDLGCTNEEKRLWLARMRSSTEIIAFNHRPPRAQFDKRFSKEHPEYFALLENGKRDFNLDKPSYRAHLCYTNEGMFKETIADIEAFWNGEDATTRGIVPATHAYDLGYNRNWADSAFCSDSVSILPHDSYRACHCPACQKLLREDRPYPGRHSELVWQFVNRTGLALEKKYPGKIVTCLAYSSYSWTPETVKKLPANVLVGICSAEYARTTNDVSPEALASLSAYLKTWRDKTSQPLLGWFHHLFRDRNPSRENAPMQIPHALAKLMKCFGQYGDRMYIQMDEGIMLEHINAYVLYRTMWNPNADVDAIMEDYYRHLYGEGAGLARELFTDMEKRSVAVATEHSGATDIWDKHFTEDAVKGYRAKIEKIAEMNQGTPQAPAIEVISKHFIGRIEKGRQRYISQIKDVSATKNSNLRIRSRRGEIVLDGDLSEEAWKNSSSQNFASNVTGQPTKYLSRIRLLRDDENLYFAFECHDPKTLTLAKTEGEADYVEIFLDPEHNHHNYYQILIDIEGRVKDWYFEGGGERADETWNSGIRVAVKRYDDKWILEAAMPRKNIDGGLETPRGRPWGANFCRTQRNPDRKEDTYSTMSKILKGRFDQPDLFGHIFFSD
jgi:hypothetical protein